MRGHPNPTAPSGIHINRTALKLWLPPLIWMMVIFSASSDANSAQHSSRLLVPLIHWLFPQLDLIRIEEIHYLFRKCAHLSEFAVLALLFWRAIHRSQRVRVRSWLWAEAGLSLTLVLLFAAGDEAHQAIVPGRNGQLSDVILDTVGGAVGLGLLWLAGKLQPRKAACGTAEPGYQEP